MQWVIAKDPEPWLENFVPGTRHTFSPGLPPRDQTSWHARKGVMTPLSAWADHFRQARAVWRVAHGRGVITTFPQMAAAVGLCKRLSRGHSPPVIAWTFNIGQLYEGARRQLARSALKSITRFVVHSRRERLQYSEWLGLDADRFHFVPLQCFEIPVVVGEDRSQPFIIAMGSARRDYGVLFEAVRPLAIPTIVIAAPHALKGLSIPACVQVRTGLSMEECRVWAQRARLCVVPIANDATASGQVTVVEAMRMGRPVVATACTGTEDYIETGVTGVLVPAGSVVDMRSAILSLWDDEPRRTAIAAAARRHAALYFSDEAAGAALGRVLDEVEAELTAGGHRSN